MDAKLYVYSYNAKTQKLNKYPVKVTDEKDNGFWQTENFRLFPGTQISGIRKENIKKGAVRIHNLDSTGFNLSIKRKLHMITFGIFGLTYHYFILQV